MNSGTYVKVIVSMVVEYFFQSVKIKKIHTNKYKNTFQQQQIEKYSPSCDILIDKLGPFHKGRYKSNYCHPAQ